VEVVVVDIQEDLMLAEVVDLEEERLLQALELLVVLLLRDHKIAESQIPQIMDLVEADIA